MEEYLSQAIANNDVNNVFEDQYIVSKYLFCVPRTSPQTNTYVTNPITVKNKEMSDKTTSYTRYVTGGKGECCKQMIRMPERHFTRRIVC